MDRKERFRSYLAMVGATDIRPTREGFVCRCPYHERVHRSQSPSFAINTDSGRFICFSGVCGKSGSFETFLIDLLGYSAPQASELAGRMVQPQVPDLENSSPLPPWGERRRTRCLVVQLMDSSILGAYDYCPVYMLQRGFLKSVLKKWRIGFDPSCSWDLKRGNADTRRVTIPVWDRHGVLIGITKRAIGRDEDQNPKYIHEHYQKSEVLYGHHLVKDVGPESPLVVVESPMSVLWLYQHGVRNVVATMGAEISTTQMKLIAEYEPVILAFDGDEAGQTANFRTGSYLYRYLSPMSLTVASAYSRGSKDPAEEKDPVDFLNRSVSWEEWLFYYQPSKRTLKRITARVRRI